MTNKCGRTSEKTNKRKDDLILRRTLSGDKSYVYHCAKSMLLRVTDPNYRFRVRVRV